MPQLDISIVNLPDRQCDGFTSIVDPGSDLPEVLREITQQLRQGQPDGTEVKDWLTGPDRVAVMAKGSGDYGLVALPIHEALVPWLYREVGVATNHVALGCRRLSVPAAEHLGQMLLSFHTYRSGKKRTAVGPNWAPDQRYLEDYAVMSIVDRIVGQVDRHAMNYMVADDQVLFAVDNGRCMDSGFLITPLDEAVLDNLKNTGGAEQHAWTTETESVRQRTQSLDAALVDTAFDAIPRIWRKLHDAEVARDPAPQFQAGTLDQKSEAVKRNLSIFHAWIGKQQ